MAQNGNDTRVDRYIPRHSPKKVKVDVPRTDRAYETVTKGRQNMENILDFNDSRMLMIMGQCSTHDQKADEEVSDFLADVSHEVSDKILIVKRAYFEKPRTSMGWEGLIIDPYLDGSYDVNRGHRLAREILLYTLHLGVPCATEYVESQTPQYNVDLVSWAAIGARTSASPSHRKLASLLSTPVGIKNDTHGDVSTAVNGILKARERNVLPDGVTEDGEPAIVISSGNPYAHLVLRGGGTGPNYEAERVREAQALLKKHNLPPVVIIDCSHDNTMVPDESTGKYKKDYTKQVAVFESAVKQKRDGNRGIVGIMMEINIVAGSQPIPADLTGFDRTTLKYGQSITDACIDLQTAKRVVMDAYRSF